MRVLMAILFLTAASTAAADGRFYVGSLLGYDDESFSIGDETVKIEEWDWRMFYGYAFNDHLSVQADLIRVRLKLKVDGQTIDDATPWLGEVSVRPTLPLGTSRAQLYVRAGYVFKIRDDDVPVRDDWSWAGGLEFFVTDRWSVRGEYYGIGYKSDDFENGVVALGFAYNLPANIYGNTPRRDRRR